MMSLNNLQSWVVINQYFRHHFFLDYLQIPWHLLIAPFFFLFLIHFLKVRDRFSKLLRVILPLFILAIILQVSFVLKHSGTASNYELDLLYEEYISIEELVSLCISILVFSYSFYVLYKKQGLHRKVLSIENLKWIYLFFGLGTITYATWLYALVEKFRFGFEDYITPYYPVRVFTTLLIYWMAYQAFVQLRIIKERELLRATLLAHTSTLTDETTEVKEIKLHEDDRQQRQFEKVDAFIKLYKKFLLPKYSLKTLSKDVNLSVSTLSLIINIYGDNSFVDYINVLRIEQAKKLLIDPKYTNYTIVSIGLESGFNSKSSFYAVFKKYTDITPSEYRKKQA